MEKESDYRAMLIDGVRVLESKRIDLTAVEGHRPAQRNPPHAPPHPHTAERRPTAFREQTPLVDHPLGVRIYLHKAFGVEWHAEDAARVG